MTNIDINAINNEDLRETVRAMYIAMTRKPLIIELEDTRAEVQGLWDSVIEPTANEDCYYFYDILKDEPNTKDLFDLLNRCMNLIDEFNDYIDEFMV